MYYYFSAKFSSILKINGVYYGEIDKKIKRVQILERNAFIEVCPLELKQVPFSFILNEKFLSSPPNGVSLVDLKGGFLIEFDLLQDNSPFRVLSQEKFSHAVVTVFKENGLKVSIETPTDFFAETVSFATQTASISHFVLANKPLIAIKFSGEDNLLNCYLLDNKIKKVFSRKVSDFSFANGFSTTEEILDIAKHRQTCSWILQDDKFVKGETSLSTIEDFCMDNLPEHVLGYAFLEELACGGNVDNFLNDNIKDNKEFLTEYLGNFLGVMPPPDFREFDEIGLIYKHGENKYKVEYFRFEIVSRKISNITKTN